MKSRSGWVIWLLLAFGAVGCRSEIIHGLEEGQANALQSALSQRGIEAEKVQESGRDPRWTLRVQRERSSEAIRLLAELGLPRRKADGFSELFGKGSLVPSPTEERALYLQALSGEVARTLETVDEVISARVHLVLPPPPRPGQPSSEAKASALLRVRPGSRGRLLEMQNDLRALVAGGVEGLAPAAVTMVIREAENASLPPPPPVPTIEVSRGLAVPLLGALITILSLASLGLVIRLRALRRVVAQPRSQPAPPLKPTDATPVPSRFATTSGATPLNRGGRA